MESRAYTLDIYSEVQVLYMLSFLSSQANYTFANKYVVLYCRVCSRVYPRGRSITAGQLLEEACLLLNCWKRRAGKQSSPVQWAAAAPGVGGGIKLIFCLGYWACLNPGVVLVRAR